MVAEFVKTVSFYSVVKAVLDALAQGQRGLTSSGHRLSICSRINAAWRIAFSIAATLAGLGLSGSSSISLRAHSNVAAKRTANFRSSVMGISRVEFAGSGRGLHYTRPGGRRGTGLQPFYSSREGSCFPRNSLGPTLLR